MEEFNKKYTLLLRMFTPDGEKTNQGTAAAHAPNVDDVANDEPRDPDSEPEKDTIEDKTPTRKNKLSHDADSDPSLNSAPREDEATEDELEPCAGSKQECLPNTTTTAGQNSSQSGTQRFRPNRKRV